MKYKCILILLPLFPVFLSCGSSKKATATTTVSTPAPQTSASPFPLVATAIRPAAPAPGDEELKQIQLRFKEVTMEELKQGHAIYTTGACMNCHGAAPISQYNESKWETILADMTVRAELNDSQKLAVRNYILSIKATELK